MKITVLLFASLKDAAKTSQIELELPEGSLAKDALEALELQFPAIKKWLPHTRIAVAQEYTDQNALLHDGDELALLPPVSGGEFQPHIEVVETEITLEPLVAIVQNQIGGQAGAICSFLGVVRENSKDLEGTFHDDIEYLEYEAYASMAVKQMTKIALEAFEKWGAVVAIVHRVGKLGIGEASVGIVAATPHRGESFEACRYAIEELKQRVPVWKKETAKSGVWWVETSGQNK